MIEIRKIQKPTGTSREPYVRIPLEFKFNTGDSVKFEKINDDELKIVRIK